MNLIIRYSAVKDFVNCKRIYYYKYVKGINQEMFYMPFFMGNLAQFGTNLIYKEDDKFLEKTMKFHKAKVEEFRKKLLISPKDEIDIAESKYIIKGMLLGYHKFHQQHIKEHKILKLKMGDEIDSSELLEGEFRFLLKLRKGIQLQCSIDNILKNIKEHKYLRELKTTKNLSTDYVKNIDSDLQSSIYFYGYNLKYKKKLKGIIYDVIQKPSIRRKKGEMPEQFLNRLEEYYQDSDRFYLKVVDKPFLDAKRISNILEEVVEDIIKRGEDINKFYPNESFCFIRSRCNFYNICHNKK